MRKERSEIRYNVKKYYREIVSLEAEDLFDGLSTGDLSPIELARMSGSTDEDSTLWEDHV